MRRDAKGGSCWQYCLPLVMFLVFLALFWRGIYSVSAVTEEKEMENIRKAVVQSAVFCYGTEGAYPESLDYMKEHYGLSYNEEKYIVKYDVVAKNLRPHVNVIRILQKDR
ncbi:MAG: hypothetical protein Q4D60_01070 [Eubacteriales bacterium]|nr:hypothetical protein [Eubacteriales bacterium]